MKKVFTILVSLIVSANSFAQAPNWAWARKGVGTKSEIGSKTATDNLGNVYVTGLFDSTITFGSYTFAANNGLSMFIVKYDALGNVLWANSAGGLANIFASNGGFGITTDAQGNVYMIGNFGAPTISFGAITLTNTNGLNNGSNFFIVKYDGSGNALWAKGGNGVAYSTTADASGNVYIAGVFVGSISIGTYTLTNVDTNTTFLADIFIAKYGTSGNIIWANSAGGLNEDVHPYIAADTFGNVYVTGAFNSTSMTFGAFTINNQDNTVGNYGYDIFIAKYNVMGNVLWAKDAGGLGYADYANSIATDASGNAYITGQYYGTSINFGGTTLYNTDTSITSYNQESFIVKYSASGNVLWANGIGGFSEDYGFGICTDVSSNIYVTGTYGTPITFGSTTLSNPNPGEFNAFIAKYNPAGNVIWAKAVDGSGGDNSYGIAADAVGNVFITGVTFSAPLIFGNDTLVYGTNQDMFVAKLDANGNTSCSAFYTLFPDSALQSVWYLVNQCMGSDSLSADSLDYVWQWGDSANSTSIGAYPSFTYNAAGNYTICVTITDSISGCTNTYCDSTYITKSMANQMISVNVIPANSPLITGISASTLSGRNEVWLTPNPTKGKITITNTQNKSIEILNLMGQVIYNHTPLVGEGASTKTIDVSNLAEGVYFVTLKSDEGVVTKKMVKTN